MPTIIPNLGLGYLATALGRNGYSVEILDCAKEKMSCNSFGSYLSKKAFNVVGIQVFTCDLEASKGSLEIIKRIAPGTITIVGGPHPSCTPKQTMIYLDKADFAFQGEAEIGLPQLLNQLSRNSSPDLQNIPGLVYRSEGEIICNPPIYPNNLDSLGFPAWELINPRKYPLTPHGAVAKNSPTAPIILTRGCPFECTFCGVKTIAGKKLRCRSIKNVLEEIKILRDSYGVKEIHIEDDNFTLNRDLVEEFCNQLIAQEINVSWSCPNSVRIDTLDLQLLKLMRRAGCYSLAVGIESGSQRVLDHMKKNLKKENVKEKISLIKSVGIKTTGFFMLGYPTEKREDILKTVSFAKELDVDRAQFSNFLPLPGTEIYEKLATDGEIGDLKWRDFLTTRGVVYSPKGISLKELKRFQQRAFLEFYLRPKIILNLLREIKSWQHLKYLLARAIDVFR